MVNVTVEHDAARQRYEAWIGEQLAGFAAYEEAPGLAVFTHTEVDDAWQGRGVGSALVQGALDDVRARGGLKVQPRCPFVAAWLDRHPDYAGLVAQA